jgi:hypothetical protein
MGDTPDFDLQRTRPADVTVEYSVQVRNSNVISGKTIEIGRSAWSHYYFTATVAKATRIRSYQVEEIIHSAFLVFGSKALVVISRIVMRVCMPCCTAACLPFWGTSCHFRSCVMVPKSHISLLREHCRSSDAWFRLRFRNRTCMKRFQCRGVFSTSTWTTAKR